MSNPGQGATVDVAALIDSGRFSPRQWVIVVLCGLLMFVDGYDMVSVSYVAPTLVREWGLTPGQLTLLFTGTGISGVFSAVLAGPLSDRYGRRPVILWSVLLAAVASFGGAWSGSFVEFLAWRLVGGLGLAALMSTVVAIGAEYAPARVRSFTVTAFFSGYPVGAAAGAAIAAQIIPAYGWHSVMIVGGVMTLAIAALALLILPESIRFLVLRDPTSPRIRRELRKIDRTARYAEDTVFTTFEPPATRTPIRDLFRERRATMTGLIWVIYFMNLMMFVFLTNWTPILMRREGFELEAVLHFSMYMQIGTIVGGLVAAFGVDRLNSPAALVPAHLLGFIGVAAFSMLVGGEAAIFAVAFLIGAGVMGAHGGMNGLTARLYPTAVRSTAVSSALGAGRVGMIVGPILGGALVALKLDTSTILLLASIPPLISTLTIFTLWRQRRRA